MYNDVEFCYTKSINKIFIQVKLSLPKSLFTDQLFFFLGGVRGEGEEYYPFLFPFLPPLPLFAYLFVCLNLG